MNTILVLSLAFCATLAVASAYPAAEPAEDAPVALEEVPDLVETEDEAIEALQPEESRWGHGGHHGGHHGHGWGHHGGYGRGHGWGHGWGHHGHGGWGHGGGWGRRR